MIHPKVLKKLFKPTPHKYTGKVLSQIPEDERSNLIGCRFKYIGTASSYPEYSYLSHFDKNDKGDTRNGSWHIFKDDTFTTTRFVYARNVLFV